MLVFRTSSCLQSTAVRHMCIGNSAPQDSRFYQHSCWSYMTVKEEYPLWAAWPWRWRHCNPSNSENLSLSDIVSHHRILKSSAVPLLEPQILYVNIWWMCCFKVSFIWHKVKLWSKVAEMALLLPHDRRPVSGLAEALSLLSWGLCATFSFYPSTVQFNIHQSSFHLMLYTLVLFVHIPSLDLEL